MIGWLLLGIALGADGSCDEITMGDVTMVPPPAVIVLGERRGTQPDLQRARRIVRRLSKRSPVTLALEAVSVDKQDVLDRFAAGEIDPYDLPEQLDWHRDNGFPWEPYAGLVTSALVGTEVVAAGVHAEPPPEDAKFPIPGGYASILRDAMGGEQMPLRLESRFVQTMAWTDHRIAQIAHEAWDGDGYLVVIAERTRVEGGKGVSFQLSSLSETPAHAFTLAWAGKPPCYVGDKVWKQGLIEKVLQPTPK